MEVPSDVQQLEPHPLGSLWTEADQQNEAEDRQGGDSDKAFVDELSKDVQPANQAANIKVSRRHPLLQLLCHALCVNLPGCVSMCAMTDEILPDCELILCDVSSTSLFTTC